MSTPINLNRFRKQKARVEKKAQADENAVRFGQTKQQKDRAAAQADKAARDLNGHKRDT